MQTAMVRAALGSLLLLASVVAAAPITAQSTTEADRFCYSYRFRNTTAETANELQLGFEDPIGSGAVSDVYLGPENPFISVTLSSTATSTGTTFTRIDFSNGAVSPGEPARIGFCNRAAQLRHGPTWRLDGAPVQPGPQVLGIGWEWHTAGALNISLFNDQPIPLAVTSMYLYDAALPQTTDALSLDTTSGMELVANLGEDVLLLPPNTTHVFNAVLNADSVTANHPYVLSLTSAPSEDLGDETLLMLQAYSPQAIFMPLLVRQ